MFSMAMWMATLVAPIQILAGDQHGLNTLEHQPAKIMAMEGHFESHKDGAPLILFGLPDQAAGKVKYAIEIPKLGSLILKHSLDAPLAGLDTVPRENWPPVPITFWSFRIMVGLGFLMLGLGLFSLWTRWRGTLYEFRLLHMFAMAMGPAGFIAVLAGWITTETGRQPFTVYGLLRTAESASPLAAPAVGSSLIAFVIVYFVVFATGVIYIFRLMASPPHQGEQGPSHDAPARAAGITPAAGVVAEGVRLMTGIIDIATVWAFIIAFAVFVYVVMDGFDLGLGILFPLFPAKADRDVIMNSVAPVWDGNETWLVLGGGGLMAAFPLAYAVLMPALYTPMIAMLIGLIFRGVAFEFRWRTTQSEAQSLGYRVRRRIAAGDAGAGNCARRHPAGRACRGTALCRRLVGLADAVQHLDRPRVGRRLCAAGRDLAGAEDRRRASRQGLSPELVSAVRDAGRDRRGQHRHAVPAHPIYRSAGSPGPTSS